MADKTPKAIASTEPTATTPILTPIIALATDAENIKQAYDKLVSDSRSEINALHDRINSLVDTFEQMIKECANKCKLLENCSSCC